MKSNEKSGQIWPKEILFKNAAKATKSNYFMCKNLHHLLKEANMHKWENLDITQHFSTKLSKFEFKIRILVNFGLPKLHNACLPWQRTVYLGYCTCTITFVKTRAFLYFLPQFMYYECKRNLNAKYVRNSTFYSGITLSQLRKKIRLANTKWYLASFSEYQKKSLSTSFTYIYLNSTTAAGWFVTFGWHLKETFKL